jgi:transcriptional repressor NrdR
MRCPACQHEDSRVVDSRVTGESIRRRRQCSACGHRFTTHERVEQRLLWVVKKDGQREPWSTEKVLHGMALACHKRPVSTEQIECAVRAVETSFAGRAEVSSPAVGRAVLDVLRDLDPVAMVRFASVYQEFESLAQFIELIRDEDA